MNTNRTTAATAKTEQPDLMKHIGKTTNRVKIHFSPNNRKIMSEKIFRTRLFP